jgi:hypothetical protein
MRAFSTTFMSLTLAILAGCSSSTSDGSTPDAGKDSALPGDASAIDTSPTGDTAAPVDAKTDTKPATDSAKADTSPVVACDPVKQTGCTGTKSKCTAIDDGSGGVVAGCVAPGGSEITDASCTRTSEDPSGIGNDTCAPGNYCSGIGSFMTPPSRHCRKFCGGDGDCATGQKCSSLINDETGAPSIGICVPTCAPFGTDCATGFNCSLLILDVDGTTLYDTCRAVGAVTAGSACTDGTECLADLVCSDPTSSGSDTCVPLCDSDHACTTGTCTPAGSLPKSGGFCQ